MTIALPRLDRSTRAERGITLADFLVPIRVGERMGSRVRHIALIVVGALFVALCAQVYIPTEPVPFTGQTFGVLLVGGALGFRRGALALLLYLAIGAVGLPVFAQGKHGIDIVQGATGGYLIGFVVTAALVGRLAELGWDRHIGGSVGAMLLGTVIIYAFGVPWLKLSTGHVVGGRGRRRPDAIPLLGLGQARRRRHAVPGRLVAGRSPSGRPLGRDPLRGRPAHASSSAVCRLRYESRSRRATSGQYASPRAVGPSGSSFAPRSRTSAAMPRSRPASATRSRGTS